MKVGFITRPNQKGQIVIPKEIREALVIDSHKALNIVMSGNGIYLYPIEEVVTETERESSYTDVLLKTQGTWMKEDWNSLRKRRGKVEIQASRKRKKSW